MNVKPENLKRALAILTTEPCDSSVKCYGNMIEVAGQRLHRQEADDMEVLSVLMADKEFGFAAGNFEAAAATMRKMQKVWFDAADSMKSEVAAWPTN